MEGDLVACKKTLLLPLRSQLSTLYLTVSGGDFDNIEGYVEQMPLTDTDIVTPVACLDGSRFLQIYGKGFGRGGVVLSVFCSTEKDGISRVTNFFNSQRVAVNTAGVTVSGGGFSFIVFPDSMEFMNFDERLSRFNAMIIGYIYQQPGGSS